MKAIAVIDKNQAIGKKGGLLFHIPSDLKHFRNETIGKTIIMGRKTLESMPGGKPLPKRNTLVLSSTMEEGLLWEKDGFYARSFPSMDRLKAWVDTSCDPQAVVVAGGGQIYKAMLPLCDELVLTEVDAEDEADAFFPDFRQDFTCYEDSGLISEDGYHYHIRRYRRTHVQER